MAEQIKFSDYVPVDTNDAVAITDITGTYNVASNPTGYGTPNAERSDFALMAIAYDMNGDEPAIIAFEEYDPESVSVFTLPLSYDGYFRVIIFVVDIADYNTQIPTNEELLVSDYEQFVIPILFKANSELCLEKLFLEITDIRRQDGQDADTQDEQERRDFIWNELKAAQINFCDANYENVKLIMKGVNEYIS